MSFQESVLREFRVQPENWLVGVQHNYGVYNFYIREDTPSYQSMDFFKKSDKYATAKEAFRELYRYLGREGRDWWLDRRE